MNENLLAKALTMFDYTYEPAVQLYDKLPYSRDVSICNWEKPRKYSGNILKTYQYELGKPQIIQNDFDIEIEEALESPTSEAIPEPEFASESDTELELSSESEQELDLDLRPEVMLDLTSELESDLD